MKCSEITWITHVSLWYGVGLSSQDVRYIGRIYQKGGTRPRFGGTTNGHYLRKGDIVYGEQGDRQFYGWVCGLPTDKTKAIAVADATGKRLGQCSERKVRLIRRATGVTWESQYIPIELF